MSAAHGGVRTPSAAGPHSKRALRLVVFDDEVLARKRQHPLDDHVVERYGLDKRLEVLGLDGQAVDAVLEHPVEQLLEVCVEVRAGLFQPLREVV